MDLISDLGTTSNPILESKVNTQNKRTIDNQYKETDLMFNSSYFSGEF